MERSLGTFSPKKSFSVPDATSKHEMVQHYQKQIPVTEIKIKSGDAIGANALQVTLCINHLCQSLGPKFLTLINFRFRKYLISGDIHNLF